MAKYSTTTGEGGGWELEIPEIELLNSGYEVGIKAIYRDLKTPKQLVKCAKESTIAPDLTPVPVVVLDAEVLKKRIRVIPAFKIYPMEARFSEIPDDEIGNYTIYSDISPFAVDYEELGKIMLTAYKNNEDGTLCIVIAPVDKNVLMQAPSCQSMLAGVKGLSKISLKGLDTSETTIFSGLFSSSTALAELDVENLDLSNAIWIDDMFSGCSELPLSDECLNLSNKYLRAVDGAFRFVDGITSNFVANLYNNYLESFGYMFMDREVTDIDFSVFHLKDLTGFFASTPLDDIDLSALDTSSATSMFKMFHDSSCTKLDLSSFNTSNVTNMSYMFSSCNQLQELNLPNFDTSNVTDMSYMFASCPSLVNLDLSNFDTSKVTDMSYMFDGCDSLLELDISNFVINEGTTVIDMFSGSYYGSPLPLTVYVKDEATKAFLEDPANNATDDKRKVTFVVKQ